MEKLQIAVRLPDSSLDKLDSCVREKKTSKTEIEIKVLAQHLDSSGNVPLDERMTVLRDRLAQVETQKKGIRNKN